MNSNIKTKRLLYGVIIKRICYLEQVKSSNPMDRCIVVQGSKRRGKRELMKQLSDNNEGISCYVPLFKYRVLSDFKAFLQTMKKRNIQRYFIDGIDTFPSECYNYLHRFIQNSASDAVFVLTIERVAAYDRFVDKYSDIKGKFTTYYLGCKTYAETLLFKEYNRLEAEGKTEEAEQLSVKNLIDLTDMQAFNAFSRVSCNVNTAADMRSAMYDRMSVFCECKPLEQGNSCLVMKEYAIEDFGVIANNKSFDVISVCLDDIETTRKYGVYERPNGLLDASYRLRDWVVTCNNANACKLERTINAASYLSGYDVYRLDVVWLAIELAHYVYYYQTADKANCAEILSEGKDKPSIVNIIRFCGLDKKM